MSTNNDSYADVVPSPQPRKTNISKSSPSMYNNQKKYDFTAAQYENHQFSKVKFPLNDT